MGWGVPPPPSGPPLQSQRPPSWEDFGPDAGPTDWVAPSPSQSPPAPQSKARAVTLIVVSVVAVPVLLVIALGAGLVLGVMANPCGMDHTNQCDDDQRAEVEHIGAGAAVVFLAAGAGLVAAFLVFCVMVARVMAIRKDEARWRAAGR